MFTNTGKTMEIEIKKHDVLVQAVNGRELHARLELKEQYSSWEFLYETAGGQCGAYMVEDCVSRHEAEKKMKVELKDKPKKLASILDCLIEVEHYEK